jgi:hypothetical protein
MPNDIVGDFKDDLHRILSGWERNRYYMTWDAYAQKTQLTPQIRKRMAGILRECRWNGFFGPYVDGDDVNWHQAVQMVKITGTLKFDAEFGDLT